MEKLTKALEGRDGEHDAAVAQLVSKHEAETAAAARELDAVKQGRVSSRAEGRFKTRSRAWVGRVSALSAPRAPSRMTCRIGTISVQDDMPHWDYICSS